MSRAAHKYRLRPSQINMPPWLLPEKQASRSTVTELVSNLSRFA